MSDEPKPKRIPSTAWKPGQSGNPAGRPRKGNALAECVRMLVDPRELVARAAQLAQSKDERVALGALTWLRDSAYPKPEQRLDLYVEASDSRTLDSQRVIAELSTEALRELLTIAERTGSDDAPALVDGDPVDSLVQNDD